MNTSAMTHRTTLTAVSIALAAFALGCGQPAPDNRAADEAAIMQADAAWSQAAGTKDLDAIMSSVSDDVVNFAPNEATAVGKDAFRKDWEAILALPGVAISWKATKAIVARSGDLGYSYGTSELTMTGPDGNPTSDKGKYVTVWAKQADGKWKVTADIYNTDTPLPPPPAGK